MNNVEAKRCCCEDFMPSQNGVIEEIFREYIKEGQYLREI